MQRILCTLLCLGLLGIVTGCSVDPARSGPTSAEDVRIYKPDPYKTTASKDGWVYQRDARPFP
jgi:hypothetical protein